MCTQHLHNECPRHRHSFPGPQRTVDKDERGRIPENAHTKRKYSTISYPLEISNIRPPDQDTDSDAAATRTTRAHWLVHLNRLPKQIPSTQALAVFQNEDAKKTERKPKKIREENY